MNKVTQRLLTFFIGIPLVLLIVWAPWCNHLVLDLAILASSIISTIELYNMFSTKTKLLPKLLLVIFSSLLCVFSYLFIILKKDFDYINWIFIIEALILLAIEIFSHKTFEESNNRISGSIFVVFYAGFLFTFLIRMTQYASATIIIALFLFSTFMCDSLAWLFGVTMGKNNKGIVAASPNKSIAGFIGGFFGAIASAYLFWLIFSVNVFKFDFNELFNQEFQFMDAAWWKPLILGICSAASCIVGDLTESVLKRSAEVKDSGNLIPGRGGILDSIDSIVFHAPVFSILFFFLYNPIIA